MVTIRFIILSNAGVVGILSLFLNFLLLYLIRKRTPHQLKSFSRLMLIHCVSDMCLMSTHLILGVLVLPLGPKNFLVLQGFFTQVEPLTTCLLHSLSIWLNLTAVALLSIDFYYRYKSVCFNRELSTKTIGIMVFFAYSIVWIYAFPMRNLQPNLVVGPSLDTQNYTEMLQEFPEWSVEVPSFITMNDNKRNSMHNACSIFIAFVILATLAIIIYTSIRIHMTLKKRSQTYENQRAKRVQKQVDRILAVQAFLPLTVICIPVIILWYCSVVKVFSPIAGMYATLSASWLSVIKPLATIVSIESYRRFMLNYLCFWRKKRVDIRRSGEISTIRHNTLS